MLLVFCFYAASSRELSQGDTMKVVDLDIWILNLGNKQCLRWVDIRTENLGTTLCSIL
jgi:hypothetical protein